MTLSDLIERLEEMADVHGGDVEVRLQTQEQWPFVHNVRGVTDSMAIEAAAAGGLGEQPSEVPTKPIVYIVEGRQLAYGDKLAWELT